MHSSALLNLALFLAATTVTVSGTPLASPVSDTDLATRATAPQPNVSEYRQTTSKCPPAIAPAHVDNGIAYEQCYPAVGGSYLSFVVNMPGAAPAACGLVTYTNNNCAGTGVCTRTPSGVQKCVGNTGSATLSWKITCDGSKTINCGQ